MANINFPRGLQPWENLLHAGEYTLASGYATAVYVGDPVIPSGTNRDVTLATAGTGNKILGAVIAIYDSNKVPLSYWPAANTGVGYVLVADDPRQLFVAQESSTAFGIDACNANCVLATGAGSTFNYRSGWQLDSATTPDTTAGHQIRLIRPVQVSKNDVTAANTLWIVRINNHSALQGIVGAGV